MKTFHIRPSSHACTELIVETNQLRNYMTKNRMSEISDSSKADIILVATCAFNQEFEDESLVNIQDVLKKRKDQSKVIVSGCFPKIAPKTFRAIENVESVPPLNMEKIEKLIPASHTLEESIDNTVNIHEYLKSETFMTGIRIKRFCEGVGRVLPFVRPPRWLDSLPMTDWYFIQGGNGCEGECTFCAIRYARGGIKSTPIDRVIPQVEIAVKRGYKTISFAATDMGCWGHDLNMDLADLLKEVVKVKGDFAIDMHYVEPEWLMTYMSKLEPIFNTGKVKSFGIPVQSGSNRMLERMGRAYKIEDFIKVVNHVVSKTKVRSLNSIMMLGFPGEDINDYLESYHLIEKTLISYWAILKYEGRYNIPSELMDGKVDEAIKDYRLQRLTEKTVLRNYLKLPDFIVERRLNRKYGDFR